MEILVFGAGLIGLALVASLGAWAIKWGTNVGNRHEEARDLSHLEIRLKTTKADNTRLRRALEEIYSMRYGDPKDAPLVAGKALDKPPLRS